MLIITAIKTETQRVMDYIKKLDNFDGPQIAGIAIDAGLHEEGFVIYKKFDQKVRVLLRAPHCRQLLCDACGAATVLPAIPCAAGCGGHADACMMRRSELEVR